MKYIFSFAFVLVFAAAGQCQFKHDYVWMLGIEVDSTYSYYGTSKFDFNSGNLNITKQNEGLNMYLTNASICDEDGNLLFYSNGCKINNANHELMENGDELNPGGAYVTGNCPGYGNAVSKGIMILPINSPYYYVIHQSYDLGLPGVFSAFPGHLYCSTVDMSANNGLGKVTEKNIPIITDTLYSDLHAVRHSNGDEWWIIVSKNYTNEFFKVLLSTEGDFSINSQRIGVNNDPWISGAGQAVFSPDGTKYARYDKVNQVSLFDFDRNTGELSTYQQLFADTLTPRGGISFSPNSRFLYVSTLLNLYQFDLMADDILASKVLIAEWDGFYDEISGLPVNMYLMQLGPDCKIYMVGMQGTRFLHVINKPDEPGLACDFRQHSIQIPTFNTASIPNFPNYRLGTGYPVCDSNIVYTAGRFVPPPVQGVRVWPNPASVGVTVEINQPLPGKEPATFELFDVTGRAVGRLVLPAGSQSTTLSTHGMANGMYFWRAAGGGRFLASGKLIISK